MLTLALALPARFWFSRNLMFKLPPEQAAQVSQVFGGMTRMFDAGNLRASVPARSRRAGERRWRTKPTRRSVRPRPSFWRPMTRARRLNGRRRSLRSNAPPRCKPSPTKCRRSRPRWKRQWAPRRTDAPSHLTPLESAVMDATWQMGDSASRTCAHRSPPVRRACVGTLAPASIPRSSSMRTARSPTRTPPACSAPSMLRSLACPTPSASRSSCARAG